MEQEIQVLQNETSLFTIQKCHVGAELMPLVGSMANKFVLVPSSSVSKSLCKLYPNNSMHGGFCHIDNSVVCFGDSVLSSEGYPCQDIFKSRKHVQLKDFQAISSVLNVNSLNVTLVFTDIKDALKWKKKESSLCSSIRDLLRLYTVMSNCVVFVKNVVKIQIFGLYCVIIHKTGLAKEVAGKVSSNTGIKIRNMIPKTDFIRTQLSSQALVLGGVGETYKMINEIVRYSIHFPKTLDKLGAKLSKHILLIGPPGCGKTTLALKVAEDNKAHLLMVHGPEICRAYPGETEQEISAIFKEAQLVAEHTICVLVLDEVDSLCSRRISTQSHSNRIVSHLLMLLDEASKSKKLIIIGTTNQPQALDPAVRRPGRLEKEVCIGVPNENERTEILQAIMETKLFNNLPDSALTNSTQLCRKVAELTPGYVGADLELLCQDVALMQWKQIGSVNVNSLESVEKWLENFKEAIMHYRPSSLRGGLGSVKMHPISLSDIGGLDHVKQQLKAAIEWPLLHAESFKRLGLPQPKGVLLFGPPGCAKTSMVCALANATNTTFLSTSAAELYSPFVGDSEKVIVELFQKARSSAPTILFIDEIDALVGQREQTKKGVQEQVLSTLLSEMDGVGIKIDAPSHKQLLMEGQSADANIQVTGETIADSGVVVVGATNRLDLLDSALLRPGRFDKLIYVPPPDATTRHDILKVLTARMPIQNVDLLQIANQTEFLTGADLKNLCREAALHALTLKGMGANTVEEDDFAAALKKVPPSLSKSLVERYSTCVT